jgi:hypothetical protein
MLMKRVWGHVLAGLALLAGVATAGIVVSACVHDDSTIFVDEVLAPQFVTAGTTCAWTADPTQPHITSGVLDVALAGEYVAEFLVGNQIVPAGNPNQPQTETSFVSIEGAVVVVNDSSGNQLTSYTQPASIAIPPSSGTTPGYSPISLRIIDQTTVEKLGVTYGSVVPVVTFARFYGQTLGGESVESNNFEFPVEVCNGCLIAFTSADISPRFEAPNCVGNSSSSSSTTATAVPCEPGQDFQIDCSACQGIPACRINSDHPLDNSGSDAGTD